MATTVVLGISGGIAAIKAPQLLRRLQQKGLKVKCVLTRGAKNFVNIKGYGELFGSDFNPEKVLTQRRVEHIVLAQKADLILIAPATANLIAKLAHGMADDYLTTVVLAARAPLLICPAMNVNMWANPAVQENVAVLRRRGAEIIGPAAGRLACGDEGMGRLEELDKIVQAVIKRLARKDRLKDKKILITAGPTREPIDQVRFITNASSGKMGRALAEEAVKRGAQVKLLLGQRDFVTGADLLRLIKKFAPAYEIIFHAAAVGDFSLKAWPGKLSSRRPAQLALEPQAKILPQIKKFNPQIFVAGFKAEWGLPKKLIVQKGADCTIYNDVSRKDIGFGAEDNEIMIVAPGKQQLFKKAPKAVIAGKILDYLARQYHW